MTLLSPDVVGVGEATPVAATPGDDVPSGSGPVAFVGYALLGVVLVGAQLLRVTGTRSWQAFAAEDGDIYYQDLLTDGAVTPLLRAFAGYAQLPTRLLTIPARWVPLEAAPAYFTVAGSVVTALLALCVLRWSRTWVPSLPLRSAIVALVVFAPVAADEMAANLVNIIWVFMAVLPWALVARDDGPADVAGRVVVVFLAATATGVAFAFVPLAVICAWSRRSTATATVAGAFAAGLLVQGTVMLTATDARPDVVERPLVAMAEIVGLRSTASPILGHEAARTLWEGNGGAMLASSVLFVVAALAFAAAGARPAEQVLAAALVVTAVASVGFIVWARGTTPFEFFDGTGRIYPFGHPRYSYLPSVLLTSALCVLLSGREREDSFAGVLGRAAIVIQVAVLVVSSYTLTGYRSTAPTWADALDAAVTTCRAGAEGPDGRVDVAQDDEQLRFVTLPCRDVLALDEGK